jgi:hydrogenase maturation protease
MSSVATTDPSRAVAPDGHRRPTLVVGLGNPILADDGVGWRIIEALDARLAVDPSARRAAGPVELDRAAVGGLALMERMIGFDRVVLADAILDGSPAGSITARPIDQVSSQIAGHLDSAHDVPLAEALGAGRALGATLPVSIDVVGVAVDRVDTFGDRLSPPVAEAVDDAVEAILAILARPVAGAS